MLEHHVALGYLETVETLNVELQALFVCQRIAKRGVVCVAPIPRCQVRLSRASKAFIDPLSHLRQRTRTKHHRCGHAFTPAVQIDVCSLFGAERLTQAQPLEGHAEQLACVVVDVEPQPLRRTGVHVVPAHQALPGVIERALLLGHARDGQFQGAVPGSPGAYSQVVLPAGAPAIQSDPAYEFDNDPDMNSATLYYRNGTRLYQVTAPGNVYGFDQSVLKSITLLSGTPNVSGNPLAVGGVPYEAGKHWLVARGGNEIYFLESYNDGVHLIPDRAACSDGNVPEEIFGDGHMVGCAGSVSWANRGSLCAAGSLPCSASTWHSMQLDFGHFPTHHYWTDDDLRWNGNGSGACFVSTSVGNQCPGEPMRVCSANSGTDPEGNVCNWINCGYGSNTPNEYFGGCVSNSTAGTLCCR